MITGNGLGLRALESGVSRTVKQICRVDGTFGDNLFPEDYQKDIISPSDDLRVWGTLEHSDWHVESLGVSIINICMGDLFSTRDQLLTYFSMYVRVQYN